MSFGSRHHLGWHGHIGWHAPHNVTLRAMAAALVMTLLLMALLFGVLPGTALG